MKPCFPSQLREFPFEQRDIADLWRIAKDRYGIDRGVSVEDVIPAMARDLGMRQEHIAQAFVSPKVTRVIGNDVWRKQQRRRDAIQGARDFIERLGDSSIAAKIKRAYDAPRSALTFGHGGVFPMTHMGQSMFVPSEWGTFLRASSNAWRFMSEKQYGAAIQRMLIDPDYTMARRASRSVDPAQRPVGILADTVKSRWTDRGFNALKIARFELFKREFNKLAPSDRMLENARPIMNVIDAATGEVPLGKFGSFMSRVFFAPKLIPARFKSAIIDPIRAVKTFANWKNASAGERQAARFVMKRQAQTIAFYASALALNQGVNSWLGAKDKVNFTDPSKGDWLSFKIAGLTVRPPNAVIESLRLIGGMIAPFTKTRKELRGEQPESVAAHRAADYLRYKLHPTIRVGLEVATGTDLFGRKLPFKGIRQRLTREAPKVTPMKPAVSVPEYVAGKGPIPVGGAAREFYDMLREEGMSHGDGKTWIRTVAVLISEGEGISAHETYKTKR